jgi:hypothetical protein
MVMTFGTWAVRTLYRSGALKTVASEFRFSGSTRVRWNKYDNQPLDDYTNFCGENGKYHSETGFFERKVIRSAVKTVESVSDRTSCMTLRGRWCDIIVLNVYDPNEGKSDDTKERFMGN